MKDKILLIIPAYNEEQNILKTCKSITKYNKNIDYIVINDGSKDNTEEILIKNNLNHISLIENLGIGGAVQTGYKYAYDNNYDIAVQFDGDGQHDINYVLKICDLIQKEKADMTIGTRYLDKKESNFQSTFMRRFGSKILSFLIRICTKCKVTDPTSGFRAVNKKIIKFFAENYPSDYPEPESIVKVTKMGYIVREVPVSMNERKGGTSSINVFQSIYYMVKVSLAIIIDSFERSRRK